MRREQMQLVQFRRTASACGIRAPHTTGTFPELTESELEQKVREHLSQWWGPGEVQKWQHLRTYRVPFAQPNQVSTAQPGQTHMR